ncbi:GumC family protein [Leptodesmis sp.]|uniref:GumC family protein n=1 Tax=Leptodesmis sp. TaxID=3100501 RepID=UPI00405345ED
MQATQPYLHPVAESEPGYGQLLAVLVRRRFWVLGALITAIGIGALYTLRKEPTYISIMQLLVEPNYQGKQGTQSGLTSEFSDTKVEIDDATQINLMQSSNLLRKAMKLLQVKYPDINPSNPQSVAQFKKAVSVGQVSSTGKNPVGTKIFQVTYTDNDPLRTQDALQALQKVYLDYNLEQQKVRLIRGLSFVNQQLPQANRKVKEAEAALEKFRREQELIDPELQAKTQAEAWNRIQQERQTTQTQLQELQSRYVNLQRQLALSPQQAVIAARLSQSPRYQALLNEIQKTELSLVRQRLRFKDNTDFVQQVLNQRQKQMNLLQTEVQRVLGDGAAQANVNGGGLLSQGQLGGLDLTLVGQLVDTQVNLRATEARAHSLEATEQQIRTELKRFPQLLAEYGRLQPEVELSRDTLKQLLKAQQDIGLEIARGGFDWQIVEAPGYGLKTGPDMKKNLLLAAVAGLFLGSLAAFAREAADDAVHSSDELKKQTQVPLLGMMPELSLSLKSEEDKPLLNLPFSKPAPTTQPTIAQVLQWQPFRESLDLLYQNLQLLSTAANPLKSIMVTSALAGEGKSTLVLGLAISAARLHQRVLLVDADLRRPSLHELLNLPNDQGLSTLLASDAPISTHIGMQDSKLRNNISVITAGPSPADPAKLLSSQRLRDVITTFEQIYDLVLLDVPPVLGMVDAMLVASCCSGAVMVGRLDHVTRSELTQATTMLNQLNIIGVVANGANYQIRGQENQRLKRDRSVN